LRIGAVSVGLGAAVTVGQATASAAPDDASHAGTHVSSGATDTHGAESKRKRSSAATPQRDTGSKAAKSDHGSSPTDGSASASVTSSKSLPAVLTPTRRSRLTFPHVPAPTALLSASELPASLATTSDVSGSTTAGRTVTPEIFGNVVSGALSSIGLWQKPTDLPSPAAPFAPLVATLSGAVREIELLSNSRHTSAGVTVAGALSLEETGDPIAQPPAAAHAANDAASDAETAREQSQARLNQSLGWVPVLGTAFNAFNFVSDFVDFARAALRGDTADMSDEISDMTVDLVGMIPVLGGPLAAMIHQARVPDPAPGDHAPNAVNDSFTTDEDNVLVGNVLTNDTDPDADPLTATLGQQAAHGAVVLNQDGTFTYTPIADYNGADGFTYVVSDGVKSKTATVTINVAGFNDPPIANDDTVTLNEDTPTVITVLGNDSDVDTDPLSILNASTPGHGTVSIGQNKTITYTPAADYNGTDAFVYTVSDGHGGTAVATVSLNITPVNDAPVAGADSFTTDEDNALAGNVLTNDSDAEGDPLTATLNTGPNHGSITLNADGSFTYNPTADYNGPDGFTYAVSDGMKSKIGTVTITVAPVNDAPVVADDTATLAEDTPAVIAVLGNDTDVDTDPLSVTDTTSPSHGTVSIGEDNALTYTPAADYSGTDSFTYTVADGHGGNATATVSLTVTPVNDAPVAVTDDLSTDEDTPLSDNVLTNDTDADNDALTATLGTGPAHGDLTLNPDGTFTYTPTANYNGADGFTYTVGDGVTTNTGTVTITINPVNDAPVVPDGEVALDEDNSTVITVVDKATDVENDPLSVSGATNGSHGTVSVGEDGAITYTPTANYNGPDSFTYTITDGNGGNTTATISVTVNPVNDAPVAVGENYGVDQDHQLTNTVHGTDVDGDPLTITLVSGPTSGNLSALNADGTFTYTPNPGYHGPDSFTFTVTDPNGLSATGTANITVNYVAPPPPPPPPPTVSVPGGYQKICSGGFGCAGGGYSAANLGWPDVRYGQSWIAGLVHNCTRYVAFRLKQAGVGDPGSWGNAYEWVSRAPGVKDNTPAVGAVAYWGINQGPASSSGHVGYVEAVGIDTAGKTYIEVTWDNLGGVTERVRIEQGNVNWPTKFLHIRDTGGGGTPSYPVGIAMARTQKMSAANLNSELRGWYEVGARVSLVCYVHGQRVKGYYSSSFGSTGGYDDLWYRTTDGVYSADVDLNTNSNNPVTGAC
jgi:VCBS repeat-containing protein